MLQKLISQQLPTEAQDAPYREELALDLHEKLDDQEAADTY